MTAEKLKELSGLNLTDQEAEEAVQSIRLMAKILYKFTNGENETCIENQQVVHLDEQNPITQKQAA